MVLDSEDKHFAALTERVDYMFRRQRPDRVIHNLLIRNLLPEYYPASDDRGGFKTSVPLLSMAARAMCRALISKDPRMLVNADDPQLKSWMETAEIAGNARIRRSNAALALCEVVRQSMVSFGTLFLAPVFRGHATGMALDLGIEAIDRCDYFYDCDSSTLEEPDIEGHKIRMKLVDARDHPLFDEEARSKLLAADRSSQKDETANVKQELGRMAELYEYVEVYCCYDRPRNTLYYFPAHQPELKLLEVQWMGPRHGPYRKLYFEKPPGNATPIAPLAHLLTKHMAFNTLDIKTIHQQQVAKALLAYTNASKQEAESVVNAVDNQSVLQENGALTWMHVGGASSDTVAMAEKQRRDFSYASHGIVDQFMQQADTLGQERLLRGAANDMLEDMAGWVYQFVKGFCEDVFWFDIHDPDPRPKQFKKTIQGTNVTYPVSWTREHRRMMESMEYEVDVEPYSYRQRSPDSRLADIMGTIQFVQGMADQAAMQGISIDVEAVIRTIAKYRNLPEVYDILRMNQDPAEMQALLGNRAAGGSVTDGSPKRYIRESRSDGSGKDQEVMRMFGRTPANQEVAA